MATTTTKRATKASPEKKVVQSSTEAIVWSAQGAEAAKIALPAELFGAAWNADLVHQVVTGMEANARQITAHTKFRGEVSGGGKKPWKQKGTGRARHGSNRSPIWKGGGVTHGPRAEKVYVVKINRKMRLAALVSVLSQKMRDGQVIFVDKLAFAEPKTKDARATILALAKATGMQDLATKRKNAMVVAFAKKDTVAEKSFRNMGNLTTEEVRNLNPVELLNKRYLIIENPTEALGILSSRFTKKA